MVKSGEHFYILLIALQLLFTFKQAKPWSVIVEAVKEFDWVTFVNVIECVKKMQETGLL